MNGTGASSELSFSDLARVTSVPCVPVGVFPPSVVHVAGDVFFFRAWVAPLCFCLPVDATIAISTAVAYLQ